MGDRVRYITAYFDGACAGQGTPDAAAGWSFVVEGDITHEHFGRVEGMQDNNRAETCGLLELLRWVDTQKGIVVDIVSDSVFVVEGIKTSGPRKAYADVWEDIRILMERNRHSIRSVRWVPRDENDKADELAKMAARCYLRLDREGYSLDFCLDTVISEIEVGQN